MRNAILRIHFVIVQNWTPFAKRTVFWSFLSKTLDGTLKAKVVLVVEPLREGGGVTKTTKLKTFLINGMVEKNASKN